MKGAPKELLFDVKLFFEKTYGFRTKYSKLNRNQLKTYKRIDDKFKIIKK